MACDVSVMCGDLDASARFYTALGATLGTREGGPRGDFLFGNISSLLLTLVPAAKPDVVTKNLYWGVETPCLMDVWTALDNAGFGDCYEVYPGFLLAYDPDGNRVTVRECRGG